MWEHEVSLGLARASLSNLGLVWEHKVSLGLARASDDFDGLTALPAGEKLLSETLISFANLGDTPTTSSHRHYSPHAKEL